jgi:hypothetical protein
VRSTTPTVRTFLCTSIPAILSAIATSGRGSGRKRAHRHHTPSRAANPLPKDGRRYTNWSKTRNRSTSRPIVTDICPEATSLGLASAWREHRYGRIVGVQFAAGEDMLLDRVQQRAEQVAGRPDPTGQRETRDLNSLAGVDLRLAVQRKPVSTVSKRIPSPASEGPVSTSMLVAARQRHVPATRWGTKRYLQMNRLAKVVAIA